MSSTPNIQENYLHVVEFLGKSLSIFKSHCDYTHNFALEFQSLLQIGRNLQIDYAQLIESKSSNTSTNPTTSRQSCTDIYAAKRVFDDTIGDEPIERLHTIWADDNTDVSNKDSDLNEMIGQDFNADLGQQQMKNEPEDFQTFELGADETDEPVMDSINTQKSDPKQPQPLPPSPSIRTIRHNRYIREILDIKCSICEKMFTQSSSLSRHMRVHTGEKPFSCNVCAKRFSESGNLTEHMRIHTGERPFGCELCSKRFSRSNCLKGHMRTHTGEKPFHCNVCSRKFGDSRSLANHKVSHELFEGI